jgi:chromosome segregation ATPase
MADSNPTTSSSSLPSSTSHDQGSFTLKLIELQEALVQSQEKNLMLSAQLRELERMSRDGEDLKSELINQSLLLTDKSRENKQLHQELGRITGLLEQKLQETEELRAAVTELGHQLKTREAERDLLAVMLNEAENAQRRQQADDSYGQQQQGAKGDTPGWLKAFKGKSP